MNKGIQKRTRAGESEHGAGRERRGRTARAASLHRHYLIYCCLPTSSSPSRSQSNFHYHPPKSRLVYRFCCQMLQNEPGVGALPRPVIKTNQAHSYFLLIMTHLQDQIIGLQSQAIDLDGNMKRLQTEMQETREEIADLKFIAQQILARLPAEP